MPSSEYIWLENCKILRVTERAIQVEHDDGIFWFPISQVEDADRFETGDEDVSVGITEWIAKQKGIET
jgi:hypothetical protein